MTNSCVPAGVDLAVSYDFGSLLKIGAELLHIIEYRLSTRNLFTGAITRTDHVGELNQPDAPVRPLPQNKARLHAAINLPTAAGDFSFNGSINYIDSYKDERASGPTIEDQATIDVNVIWAIRGGKTKVVCSDQ